MSEISSPKEKPVLEEPKRNDADALFVLGMRYSIGRDVEYDPVAAHKWFNLAAMMGHEEALSARADQAREMTAGQIAEAQRQARAWLWSRNAPGAPQGNATNSASAPVVRPFYVRRKAEAMRSAKAFARTVA